MSIRPLVGIHMHPKSGNFIIVDFIIDPKFGWLTEWGAWRHLSAEEMKTEGAALVRQSLHEFFKRDMARNEPEKASADEKQTIESDTILVNATLEDSDRIHFMPQVREPGGYRGDPDPAHQIFVSFPCDAKTFADCLLKAFTFAR